MRRFRKKTQSEIDAEQQLQDAAVRSAQIACRNRECRGYLVRKIVRGTQVDQCPCCLESWKPDGIKITPALASSQLPRG